MSDKLLHNPWVYGMYVSYLDIIQMTLQCNYNKIVKLQDVKLFVIKILVRNKNVLITFFTNHIDIYIQIE